MMTAREVEAQRLRMDGAACPNTSKKRLPPTTGSKTQRRKANKDAHMKGVRK